MNYINNTALKISFHLLFKELSSLTIIIYTLTYRIFMIKCFTLSLNFKRKLLFYLINKWIAQSLQVDNYKLAKPFEFLLLLSLTFQISKH